jgi:hypothetical protein
MDVPKDGVIVAGWYTPEDAVSQIANLDYINVVLEPSSEKQLKLQVSVREGAAGAGIRIRLHAIYTMAD